MDASRSDHSAEPDIHAPAMPPTAPAMPLLHAMYEQLMKRRCKVYEEWYVTALLVEDERCCGVIAWDIVHGGLQVLRAKAVIPATGERSRLFHQYQRRH